IAANMRANFFMLRCVALCCAMLRCVALCCAVLRRAVLRCAALRCAVLRCAVRYAQKNRAWQRGAYRQQKSRAKRLNWFL
ncbi:MAG: hypothetical protein VW715_07980, partial [Rhodospirillales bacterium]